jgi:hypothetical protein
MNADVTKVTKSVFTELEDITAETAALAKLLTELEDRLNVVLPPAPSEIKGVLSEKSIEPGTSASYNKAREIRVALKEIQGRIESLCRTVQV